MDGFIQFLRDNWKFLVEISIPLVSLIVLCFVKKTKVTFPSSVLNAMFIQLPSWINEAEKLGVDGKEKLRYVFRAAVSFMVAQTGLTQSDIIHSYGDDIYCQIENILSTPQKKGD